MAKRRNSDEYLDEIQGYADGDTLKTMMSVAFREVMDAEMERHLGAGFYERGPGRQGQRNGYKPRTLNTRIGKIDFEVPQVRSAEPYHPSLFASYERSERALLTTCAEMYFAGVSTRKVGEVLKKMGGFELSAATVSKVAMEIDEHLQAFRERRLDDQVWRFLVVDACYVKVRVGKRVRTRAVLVVAGVNGEGRREILSWRVADLESADTWGEIFNDLRLRGVCGVEWLVSDGHEGIQKAARQHFPRACWQRCWAHFIRNAMSKVSHKDKSALAKDLKAARRHAALNTCLMEGELVATRYEERYPRLATQIREQFEETLAVHGLPPEHQRRMYTSNMAERLMLEIKRRTRVVGVFPNEASCSRLVGARLLERHEKWLCERTRYLNMDHLERCELERSQEDKDKQLY